MTTTPRTASTSDARKQQAEKDESKTVVSPQEFCRILDELDAADQPPVLPDVDQVEAILQEAISRGDVGLVATAAVPYEGRRGYEKAAGVSIEPRVLAEFIVGSIGRGTTPPPPAREPWRDISTDRDQPTLAKVTWKNGDTQTAKVHVHEGMVLDEWGEFIGRTSAVTDVELLHTYDPVTHVPVERALIDEAARCLPNGVERAGYGRSASVIRALAALADGAQSNGGES